MNKWLHPFALLNSVCTLVLVVTGAIFSGNVSGGAFGFPQLAEANLAPGMRGFHSQAAIVVAALIIAFAIATLLVERRTAVRACSLVAVVLILIDWISGLPAVPLAALPGFVHALGAHVLFASTVALAALTSPEPVPAREILPDRPRPSLRGLSTAVLALLVLQVSLGAAFRHGATSVLWHIVGGLLVTASAVVLTMLVYNLPEHSLLRRSVVTFVVLIGVQLMLGMTIISLGRRTSALAVLIITITHTSIGTSILAAGTVVWLAIRRHVIPAAPESTTSV